MSPNSHKNSQIEKQIFEEMNQLQVSNKIVKESVPALFIGQNGCEERVGKTHNTFIIKYLHLFCTQIADRNRVMEHNTDLTTLHTRVPHKWE